MYSPKCEESDRKMMKNISYKYKVSNPIEKHVIDFFINHARILLKEEPMQLPVGLEHYD